jgi:PAS domain S-box-containing protein
MLGQSGSGTLSAVPTLRKDGSVILADMSSFRVQIGGRNFVAGLFRDVTDMHAAQEARRASEERLNEAQRIARVGNWELDLISGRLAWSNEIFRIFEIDREKFGATYDAFLNAIHPEDRAAVDKAYSDSLLTRQPYDIVHRLLMSDGRIKYVHEHCESTFDAEGKPVLSVGTIQDVTERKLAENQLAESYRLLEAIVDTVPVRIFWKDRNSRFLGGNAAFAADAGLTQAAELIGKDDYQFPWKDQAEIYRADDRKVMAEGIAKLSYEEPHTSRGGGAAWLRTSKVPLRDVHGDIIGVLGVYDDITERRNTEQELLNLNSRLQATLQAIPDVLFELDVEGRYHEVWARNPALLAAERDRLLGHTVTKLLPPEAAGVVLQALRNAAEHGFSQGEQIRLSLADGEHWFELSTARKNGNPGDPLRFVMLSRDFTDRKHAEQLVLRLNVELEQRVALRTEELLKANRELETFSYSVAHDLRAPLRGIDGYSRLLLTDHVAQLDDEGRTFLNNIVRATQHMNEVIEDLLVYSRLERREMQIGPIDLQALSESVLAERAGEIKARGVAVRVAVDCRSALADREGLTMALRNLLENALKFSRDVSQPAIEITGRDSGSACILSVRDNGVGFDMKFHDRIFEIFQRLHRSEDYPGTGVGLAIVRKAMERMNGRVWAESTPGKGATFHLEIPE